MGSRTLALLLTVCQALAVGSVHAQGTDRRDSTRVVLVELFTSQGCDMCPEAERVLGAVAEGNQRIVPIAFHVDYFNGDWKDPFSEKLYSDRQSAYDSVYTKPKHPEYGLYYTPMVMVDGQRSENGRDRAGIQAAVREARQKKPLVELTTQLEHAKDRRSGDLRVTVNSRSPRTEGRELLICAVLRDDRVTTRVGAGENANKTLTNRFPARTTRFEFIKLDGSSPSTSRFPFQLDPEWKAGELGIVVFAQDRRSGEVHQTAFVPWDPRAAERQPVRSSRLDRR